MKKLYTIGHSNLPIEDFLLRLKKFNIDVLVDVRTSPFSRHYPQFNKDILNNSLQKEHIRYLFLGKELGARTSDASCFIDGKVSYDLLSQTELFKTGLNRLRKGLEDFTICLMCAEQDPLECHRMILVTKNIKDDNIQIEHILKNGSSEIQNESIQRLRRGLKLDAPDLFQSEEDLINKAFKIQGEKIAYEEQNSNE